MNRRRFISGLAGLGAAGIISGLYTWQMEPFWLEFRRHNLPIDNLPNHLEGKTLMQVSDLHAGSRVPAEYLQNSMQKAQKLNPDFVVYTGDYITHESDRTFDQLNMVMQRAVKGEKGTVAIMGNHDYGNDWKQDDVADQVTDILSKNRVQVLRNQSIDLEGFNITGLDDFWCSRYNPLEVLSKLNHDQANLVLCHNPDVMDEPVWQGYRGWVLSGHTHGGQVKPPFLDPPLLPVRNRRYTSGFIPFSDGRKLYINRGLGYIRQVRFNVRPEITVFTLTSQPLFPNHSS